MSCIKTYTHPTVKKSPYSVKILFVNKIVYFIKIMDSRLHS